MESTPEPVKAKRKYNLLAMLSFAAGLLAILFAISSILYLGTVHGGAGAYQSLLCGTPFLFVSSITGALARLQISKENQRGAWMATLGIVFGIVFFVISWIVMAISILPFLLGNAH